MSIGSTGQTSLVACVDDGMETWMTNRLGAAGLRARFLTYSACFGLMRAWVCTAVLVNGLIAFRALWWALAAAQLSHDGEPGCGDCCGCGSRANMRRIRVPLKLNQLLAHMTSLSCPRSRE